MVVLPVYFCHFRKFLDIVQVELSHDPKVLLLLNWDVDLGGHQEHN